MIIIIVSQHGGFILQAESVCATVTKITREEGPSSSFAGNLNLGGMYSIGIFSESNISTF